MADWDPPFPFDAGRIRDADERYWEQYGPTPKAFVSLADGRRLWGSRFGSTTSLRIVAAEATGRDQLAETITPAPEAIGWTFQPVKRQALEAAAGTTPFGVLFLSFSMFLIASAVMLTAMLFRLGVTTRAAELGLLATVGLPRRTIVRLLLGESLPVAVAGGLLGTIAGAGYAALMLLGLRTWWQAAVAMPLLRLHVTSTSLAIGALAGVITGAVTIAVTLWQASGIAPRRLLAGLMRGASRGEGRGARSERVNWSLWVGWTALGVAAVTVLITGRLDERAEIAAFFAAATLTLVGGVMLVRSWLVGGWGGGRFSLATLAARGAAREPGRATLSVALVAAACFLIVAVSAFHIDTQSATGPPPLDSGAGGFTLYAESTQPIFHDLGTEAGQRKLGFTDEERRLLGKCTVIPLRAKPGDQASCLNLYQAQRPRLVGVGERLVEHDGFAWADVPRGADNPWRLLSKNAGQAPPLNAALPMIVDHNVAIYSLHLYGGVGEQFPIRAAGGQRFDLEIVATLAGSVFQGDLLVSEADLMQMFPAVSGYRVFLIDSPVDQTDRVRAVLEDVLGPYGLAAERTERRLADFLAVQNTYLATFRALGGLGLLLGTVGLAVVQLRSVIERRAELALLRAVGFRRRRLGALVLLETAVLLAAGLIVGTLAALIAVLPHLLTQQAHVPWLPLTGTLVLVFAVGLIASGLAVRAAVRVPLLATLRRERV